MTLRSHQHRQSGRPVRAGSRRRRPAPRAAALALSAVALLSACGLGGGTGSSQQALPLVGLIVKDNVNPYFNTLVSGADKEAAALGVKLEHYAGTSDGDTTTQINAIDTLMAQHAKGILITPSGQAVLPAIAKARSAGLLVVALDSPTDPASAVDGTFATDNFSAGQLIGAWARAEVDPAKARIAMLDLSTAQLPVDVARDQGFLKGFGIDIADPDRYGDETDPRIVGHAYTGGSVAGGKTAMAQLLAKDPSINLVYTINEQAAEGAYQVLRSAGRLKGVTIVSIDGGCSGIAAVASGEISATAMQFPLRMARLGVDAVLDHAMSGGTPGTTPGLSFFNTGTQLVAQKPVTGLYVKNATWAKQYCWG